MVIGNTGVTLNACLFWMLCHPYNVTHSPCKNLFEFCEPPASELLPKSFGFHTGEGQVNDVSFSVLQIVDVWLSVIPA